MLNNHRFLSLVTRLEARLTRSALGWVAGLCFGVSVPAAAQTDIASYGCGVNPTESLVLVGGSGSLGSVLELGVDNPLGTQPAGSLALLAVSTAAAPGFPCGLPLPGFGMVGPYGTGELLVSLSSPNPIQLLGPLPWAGPGQPALLSIPVPDLPLLLEREIFFQGVMVDPAAGTAITEGAVCILNGCPGLGSSAAGYDIGNAPRQVRTADFNADGILDLAVANKNSDSISILLGLGDGTFGPQTQYPTGIWPLSLAVADLDGNGTLDLAVANDGYLEIDLLFGDGAGAFSSPVSFAAGSDPRSIQAADLDGDGDQDLCVAAEDADQVTIALNQGGGTFVILAPLAVGEEPLALEVADLDGDGREDIVSANNDTDDLSVLFGLGGASFAPEQRLSVGDRSRGVLASDLNADGVLDLVSANAGSDDLSILIGLGSGTFAPEQRLPSFSNPNEVAAADVDGDGAVDLIVAHDSGIDLASVFFGRGDGTFGEAQPLPAAGDVPSHLAIGDFDGNGSVDAAFSNLQFAARRVVVLLNACGN